jgi:nuclease HARBI1
VSRVANNRLQRVLFNGKDKIHALKNQGTSAPDGLIVDIYGPVCSRRHDQLIIFNNSRFNSKLRDCQLDAGVPLNMHFKSYADKGYMSTSHCRGAYKRRVGLPAHEWNWQKRRNDKMKAVRAVGAEFPFAKVANTTRYIDYAKVLTIQVSAVGKFYIIAALLANVNSCLYGNTTRAFFDCLPPSLSEYMHCLDRGIDIEY